MPTPFAFHRRAAANVITSVVVAGLLLIPRGLASAADAPDADPGLRVFSAGHSFHVFMPGILAQVCQSAGIKNHKQLGVQSIGGSRVIQHWDLPAERNTVRPAIESGRVQVLTLSPIYLPDAGIENFVRLVTEKSPGTRVLLQEFWLPYDVFMPNYQKERPKPVDRDARTVEEIRREHEAYFKTMDDYVKQLNESYSKEGPLVFVTPVGQAAVALREKIIAGTAPGLKKQNDLFTDAIGHATAPLRVLCAYVHYAVIYQRSPVGLPMPAALVDAKHPEWDAQLNTLLQELAWQAAVNHPLSGVKSSDAKSSGAP